MNCSEFESLIGSYLDGTIPDEKKENFEEHYFICNDCFASLKVNEILYRKKVNIVSGEKRKHFFVFKPLLVVAALILIVFSSLFFVDLGSRNKKLIEISCFTPPLYIKGENRGYNVPSVFDQLMEYYSKGDYDSSYKIIKTIKNGNPQIWFFSGILGLINGENENALSFFNMITNSMDPSYYDEAIYYRSICFLRMNRKGDALKELRMLEKMFSPLSGEASKKIKLLSGS